MVPQPAETNTRSKSSHPVAILRNFEQREQHSGPSARRIWRSDRNENVFQSGDWALLFLNSYCNFTEDDLGFLPEHGNGLLVL